MAKGAANERALGDLHSKIARVFNRVLETYEERLDAPDVEVDADDPMGQPDKMPSPIMLGAITKFLKDNAVAFDTEEIEQLSATQERLAARKAKRGKLASLTTLELVANNG